MKKGQFVSLLKRGQKVFNRIDLEDSFVNEDLSNLTFKNCFIIADFSGANLSKTIFENCNLKTCIFNYSNIEQAVFQGNILDDAEFHFVHYNELILTGNTYYACDFTKEILEEIRYANYPGFHIINVYAGWFEVVLVDRLKKVIVTASDYLGNDAPCELLKALCELCKGGIDNSITKWLCWDEEPGAYIWKLTRDRDKINIAVYTAKRDSFEISQIGKDSLEHEEIYCTDIQTEGEFIGFIREVTKSFEKIRDSKAIKNFEKEWGCFPNDELAKLKKYISTYKNS